MIKKLIGISFALVFGIVATTTPVLAGPGENDSVTPPPKPPIIVYGPGEND